VALAIQAGADIVRVHDVEEMVRVVKMSDAITRDETREDATEGKDDLNHA
jgi:dihydropteroate synthase